MSQLQLIYTSERGGSIVRGLPHDEKAIADAMARLMRRHIEARLMCGKEQIGEVYERDGQWNYVFDPAYIQFDAHERP